MHGATILTKALARAAPLFIFAYFALALPSFAAAQTAAVQTAQLLPLGSNTCQAVTVTDIQPYIYGGELESFDVTISDISNSYVGILAEAGGTPIPLNFITRWAGTPSGLKIHVDTQDIPVHGGVPVNLTLLASPSGQPTCISSIAFSVDNTGAVGSQVSSSIPVTNSTTPVQSTSATNGTGGTTAGEGAGQITQAMTGTSSNHVSSSSSSIAATATSQSGTFINTICTGNNAYRLWFILLAIYVVIVAVVVFAEPWFLEDSVLGSTASILVPLILLLLFWYFSAACRAASWIPVLACVIAIVGLFLAFREYETPPLLAAPARDK